jgi:hypothetical protein
MSVPKKIKKAIEDNPEIRVVLGIAQRAREAEAKELPRELSVTTGVVALPTNQQLAVNYGIS